MSDHEQSSDPQTPPSAERTGDAGLTAMAPEVSRRVGSILDAVEREAERLREEAREEARRYLEYSRRRADGMVAERQQRIVELSDELIRKAEAIVARLDDAAPVRRGFENLVRALGDAAEQLSAEVEQGAIPYEPPSVSSEPPPDTPSPDRAPPSTDEGAQDSGGGPAGIHGDAARHVAVQMAAAGSTRGQVRENLDYVLGVRESRAILDEIYGRGSSEDARAPWAASPGSP